MDSEYELPSESDGADVPPEGNVRRHTWLQEYARMQSPIYRAVEQVGRQWDVDAVCSTTEDAEIFFAPENTREAAEAASVCWSCPVRLKCLEWACAAKERFGIWGGLPLTVRMSRDWRSPDPSAFDYDYLSTLPNPYATEVRRDKFHNSRLVDWSSDDE